MKPKVSLTAALSFLLLAVLACSPFGPITPTASATAEQPTALTTPSLLPPIISPTMPPSTATVSPTPTATVPAPTPESVPAAPAQLPPGNPIQLEEIHMVSQTEGWGISAGTVLTTADGGKTWHEVTPPESIPSGTETQAYGAFLNAQTAWIVFAENSQIAPEASVWHTTDGGHHWTPGAPLFHQIYGDSLWAEFAALDAQNAWVMVRGVYVGAGTHFNHELFHTADGGLTWTSLDGEISDDYTGMVFADTKFGLRALQNIGAYENWPPSYDVTTDGGATWENRELPPPPGAPDLFNQYLYCETYQPVLLSAQSIRLLMGCFDYSNPPKQFTSYLYSSQDGGTTWTTVHLPGKVLASQDTLFYFDANHALLLGRDIYQSANGGQTWSFVQPVNWDGQFSFVDPLHGWAVGGEVGKIALVNTVNGGRTWVLIKPVIAR